MTQKQYDNYVARVEKFFADEGINNLSGEGEPFFSKSSCDCCGASQEGNREEATGYNPTTREVQEYEVCSDCIYFATYGQLDDMTMLSIQE